MVSKKRHLAKAITWRVLGTLDTIILGSLLSGNIKIGLTLGSFEIVTKFLLYYIHERVWYNFSNYGLKNEKKEKEKQSAKS